MKKLILFALPLIIIFLFFIIYPRINKTDAQIITAPVSKGEFKINLFLKGELKATKTTNISSTIEGKVIDLVPDGSIVEKGQPVAWMEREELERKVEEEKANLEIAKLNLEKALQDSDYDAKVNELALKEAEAKVEYHKARLQNAKNELEKTKRMVEANLSPRKALEEAELNMISEELQLKNAEITLQKAKNSIITQGELKKAEVEKARIEVEKAEYEYEMAREMLENTIIKSPRNGLVVYKEVWKGGDFGKVQAGDSLWRGQAFMEIPDLSEMVVEVLVDEVDISRLDLNMPAFIQLPSFPDKNLTGKIVKFSTLAKELGVDTHWRAEKKSTGRKVFEVDISINEKIPSLRPGLTAQVEIIIKKIPEVISIPIEALFKDDKEEYVYILDGKKPVKVLVKSGETNFHNVVILSGLTGKERVCLVNPYKSPELKVERPEMKNEKQI